MNAMKLSPVKSDILKSLLKQALTDKINDRETFMKSIDYSYFMRKKRIFEEGGDRSDGEKERWKDRKKGWWNGKTVRSKQ